KADHPESERTAQPGNCRKVGQPLSRVSSCHVGVSPRRSTVASGLPLLRESLMRSDSARVIRHTRSTALSLHLPLRRLALCLDCEACFGIGAPSCPACGGASGVLPCMLQSQGP